MRSQNKFLSRKYANATESLCWTAGDRHNVIYFQYLAREEQQQNGNDQKFFHWKRLQDKSKKIGYIYFQKSSHKSRSLSGNLSPCMQSNSSYDFIIIGAGFSGICIGLKLKQAGYMIIFTLSWKGTVTWAVHGGTMPIPEQRVMCSRIFIPFPLNQTPPGAGSSAGRRKYFATWSFARQNFN